MNTIRVIIVGLIAAGFIIWFMWPDIKGLWQDFLAWPFEE